jgi:hypothetical protein
MRISESKLIEICLSQIHFVNMKPILILVVPLFMSSIGLAQQDTVFIKQSIDWTADTLSYETDTIVFESGMVRHILTGTTVLPNTHNQFSTWGYGLYLNDVTKSDCQNHGEEVYSSADRINSVELTDTTLTIDITVYDNCCYDFLCDVSADSSGPLNLIYYGYGTHCACECCFGLVYHFSREFDSDTNQIDSVVLQGDVTTRKKIK